ncbi:MAG: 23S rRNA (guanosine(2251)-2'-O)-methyltransferase RlmB [Hyphomicrobiales bacterium]
MADKKKKAPRKQWNNKPKKQSSGAPTLNPDEIVLYGIHAVKAALLNKKRRFIKVLATRNAADRLTESLNARGLSADIVEPEAINALTGPEAVHQGMAALVRPIETQDIHDVQDAKLAIVLDQITDPHNVGAIMRSATALGVDAIITTHRNAPRETGLLAKTASGGLEHINLVNVTNLAQALTKLNDFGFVTIGLDSEGPQGLNETLYGDKIALVLGAEGKGLRRLTRERCDVLARIDMPGPIKSLNVSNAATLSTFMASQYLNKKTE